MGHWLPERARKHCQSRAAYRGQDKWTGSKLQVFELLEKDFLYQCRAFKHVVPAKPLSAVDSKTNMNEIWRTYSRDLGFFACKHCRQFSKARFCEEVSACRVDVFIPASHPTILFDVTYLRSPCVPVCDHHDRGKDYDAGEHAVHPR
jgi:hypothetical protein